MHAFVGSDWFIVLLVGMLAILFVLPTVIALCRHVDDLWFIIFLNALAGVVGVSWPVALVYAIAHPRRTTESGLEIAPRRR
jgi:Superinfection immunity protein